MRKVAAIGSKDIVLAFKALGITAVPVLAADDARRSLMQLAGEGYAVIFITEEMATEVEETISRYKSAVFPAIIPIPGAAGSTGFGMKNVRSNVEKAIGADVLFK